ncbi:MAG: hypothetical protein MJ016_05410, partial [Victivallaceae bacterium]|nr:hypothetical protein [Victivallaceae bacterium]
MAKFDIVLLDAYSQIFRAFFAIRMLTDGAGNPVNALYIFTKLLLELERDYPSPRGAMLFDCGKVDFRLKLNPGYKANRPPMPEDLKCQIPRIKAMADAFGWPQYAENNFEADDLIGGIVRRCAGREIGIVSADKDLSQLVDARVRMISPAKGGGFEERGIDFVVNKFGVPPEKVADFLALVGDSSDNIEGIPGIGPKGAAQLLQNVTIESYLQDPAALDGTQFAAKLAGREELLRRNLALVRLKCELPEKFSDLDARLCRRPADWEKVRILCDEAGFRSIVRELPSVGEAGTGDLFAAPPPENKPETPPAIEQGEL